VKKLCYLKVQFNVHYSKSAVGAERHLGEKNTNIGDLFFFLPVKMEVKSGIVVCW